MIINRKNKGSYIPYTQTGSQLSFRQGALKLDLSRYERDYPVHLDISEDDSGKLVVGSSFRYIVEIDIPARGYKVSAGEKDDMGFALLTKTAVPFDVDKVTLTLWAVEA
jgi:hypothetical protein